MSALKPERRRRRLLDEGEDVNVENSTTVVRSSECESEDENPSVELSECESAVDESADQEGETEDGSETETEEGSETEEETGSETEGYTDEEGLEKERQSGDGEEQPDNDKPDDDEDKKNPAYVPRKGAFYEHDFRSGGDGPDGEVKEEAKPKKKLWQDEGKWSHDRYIDDLQAPKSRQELIDLYGYDIRSADKPPEAPPRMPQRGKGPRKQQHFKDFMPHMAVIDTTDGGQDSVPNLDDDDEGLIQYSETSYRNERRNKVQNSDSRRGRRGGSGRGNYHSIDIDIEAKNDRNRPGSGRINYEGYRSKEVPTEDKKPVDDFPSLGESARQAVPKETQSWKRTDNAEKMWGDTKFNNNRAQKSYQAENHDSFHRNEFREDNRNRFQQTQDIRKQEDTRGKHNSQYGFKDERRNDFTHSRARGGNSHSQAPNENWRSPQNEFRDGFNRTNDYGGNSRGGHNDYSYNRRTNQQQQIAGGTRGPKAGTSGDASGYFLDNQRKGRGSDQNPHKQQLDFVNKDAREFTNTSYKYPEVSPKEKNVQKSSAAPMASANTGYDIAFASVKNEDISNKENVQTVNVTITSSTTEKKSYAKERRAKGISRPVDGGAVMVGSADSSTLPVAPISGVHYPPAGVHLDLTSPPLSAGASHYTSNRPGGFAAEPPLVAGGGAKLYNPSLPPPSFYQREHGGLPSSQHPVHTPSKSVQDPAHYSPTMLPPATALPFGLPVSNTGLALPPNAAGIPKNPALFQPPSGPPPSSSISAPATAMIAAPFLPAGMMYTGGPRVPPPGTPTGFPLTLAYTSPPPQGTVAAAVVGNQPPPQVTTSTQGLQATGQHKKVYRGDITYYAPELQQPSRTPQKRPKAAIPIIDPEENKVLFLGQQLKDQSEFVGASEKFSLFARNHLASTNTDKLVAPPMDIASSKESTQVIAVENNGQKGLLGAGQVLSAQFSSSSTQLQRVPEPSSSLDVTNGAGYTGNMKSAPSCEGSESKRTPIKTELSPGGPPVNNTGTILSKDTEQTLSATMQNMKLKVGSSVADNPEVKLEICEKTLSSTSDTTVV